MVANKLAVEFLAVTEITGMRFLIGAVLMFLLAATAGQLGGLRRVGPGPIGRFRWYLTTSTVGSALSLRVRLGSS